MPSAPEPLSTPVLTALQQQLVWSRMLAIVEEQAQTLMRTAFSTVVREAGDLSAGLFTPAGEMLAQAVTGTPGHVNAMAAAVAKFLVVRPLTAWQAGDVMLTNDPWQGTGHLNDFTVVTPVFVQAQCIALFASTSHIADVGGRGFGPDANDLFEEGLQIPISLLFDAGRLNDTLMAIVRANVRDPVVAEGDLYSLCACNDAGAKALLHLLQDFGLISLAGIDEHILETSRQAMQAQIALLKPGVYNHHTVIDGYQESLTLRCALTISATQIQLDFAGSAGASKFGINVPLPYTEAYASFGVRCVVGGDVPNNAGSLSPIKVTAPTGSLLAAERPSAVSARHAVGQMLPDLVLGCLAQVIPERVPAEGASCIWNPVFRGDDFVINPIYNGGTGARADKDGLATTAFPSGVRTTPTEINEATSPLVTWVKEYRPGSGGAGQFRGGLGQRLEFSHQAAKPFTVSKMFDRIKHPAAGRQGGMAGAPGRVFITAPDGTEQSLKGKGVEMVPSGFRLILETPGGGGSGSPEARLASAQQRDEQAGIATEAAPEL
jgi:N-methylhydantoinase B